jgi:chemotaxis protein methyltransferase CheR
MVKNAGKPAGSMTRAAMAAWPASMLARLDGRTFLLFQELVNRHAGIWLGEHKKALLAGRLAKRLRDLELESFERYFLIVKNSSEERAIMLDLITTNETYFFREPQQFKFLEEQLVPEWKQAVEGGRRSRTLNIWSAGCSSGEEPCSIAMLLLHSLPPEDGWNVRITGTDISTRMLNKSEAGVWPIERAKNVPVHLLKQYMLKGVNTQAQWMRAKPALRKSLRFAHLNLKDAEYGLANNFDLIFCRNVLIYFDPATKVQVVRRLFDHLAPGGWLFLSPAESAATRAGLGNSVFPGVYVKRCGPEE